MAAGDWWDDSPGLRQVFGAIVQASSDGASTAGVWSAIRDAAQNVATSMLNVTQGPGATEEDISELAGRVLAGITATQVSQARSSAGQLVSAHANLVNADPSAQITSDMIGVPPWAQTVNTPGVRTQYRIRIQREITVHGFSDITRQEWATYNLSGPITNVADATDQANTLFANSNYNRNVDINQILDYAIEAI